MKKLMISMLAMAAMVSCTNEIENPDQPQVNQNEPTPIEFGSSILGVQTKAAPGETAEAFDVGEIMGITMYLGEVPTGASLGTPSKDNVSFTVETKFVCFSSSNGVLSKSGKVIFTS